MNDKWPLYVLGGVALLVYLRRERSQKPGYSLSPVPAGPLENGDTLPDPKIPETPLTVGGLSLGWAPALPVRPAFVAENWESSRPTPGRFYAVKRRDHIEGIASKAIRQLAEEAAELAQMTPEDAGPWIDGVSRSASLVRAGVDSISTGWNDELYGSGRVEITAPHGRGLDLGPCHDDVRGQLIAGRTPRRNLSTQGRPTKEGAKSRPYIWVPRWDVVHFLEALHEGHTDPLRSAADPYGSGITGHWPCPAVTERGVLHG